MNDPILLSDMRTVLENARETHTPPNVLNRPERAVAQVEKEWFKGMTPGQRRPGSGPVTRPGRELGRR